MKLIMSKIEFGSGFDMDATTAQNTIDQIIEESEDLVSAVESIGAMYGIPSTNVLCDDIRSIRVTNGNITVPMNKSAANNKDTIIQSISAALDQISQRINDKIDDIQSANVEKGNHDDTLANRIDPSKGTVVMTTTDEDGEPVIVYDSGIIVAAHTPAGRKKSQELRASGNIPSTDPLPKEKPSYFSDVEDITRGIKECDKACASDVAVEYSMSSMCGEDPFFIDVVGKRGDTRSLGFDTFTSQGYSCVRRLGEAIQEAANNSVDVMDIKHMKFDNSHIFKAIECLNKARAEQNQAEAPEKINMDRFVASKYYKEAINNLEKQFDCHLAIKWIHTPAEYSSAFTAIYPTEYRDKITVSKSKGFQLNGAPVNIYIYETGITELIAREPELFGQNVISILVHEIFHNIAGAIRYQTGEMITSLNLGINMATITRDPKKRREIIEGFVNTLAFGKVKLNRIQRKRIVNNILAVIAANSDEQLAQQYHDALEKGEKDDDKNADMERAKKDQNIKRLTKAYAKAVKKAKPKGGLKALSIISIVWGSLLALITVIVGAGSMIATPAALGLLFFTSMIGLSGTHIGVGIDYLAYSHKYKKLVNMYKNSKDMEEYYADLLSATYQLPQRFFIGGITKYTPNEISQDVLNEWVKVEKCAYESLLFSSYPSTSERTHAGVTVAKKLLECKGLDPNVKKYAEWIVANNDSILNSNIDSDYNTHTYDPEEAKDIDKHIQSLITNNNIATTEAAFDYLLGNNIEEGL
jgi:hypothetical protein